MEDVLQSSDELAQRWTSSRWLRRWLPTMLAWCPRPRGIGPPASGGPLGARSARCLLLPVCVCVASLACLMQAVAYLGATSVRRAQSPRAGRAAKLGLIHRAEPARGVGAPCSPQQGCGSGEGRGGDRRGRGPTPSATWSAGRGGPGKGGLRWRRAGGGGYWERRSPG